MYMKATICQNYFKLFMGQIIMASYHSTQELVIVEIETLGVSLLIMCELEHRKLNSIFFS